MSGCDGPRFKSCPTCGEWFIMPYVLLCPNCFKEQCRFCGLRWVARSGIYFCPKCGCDKIDVVDTKEDIVKGIDKLRKQYEIKISPEIDVRKLIKSEPIIKSNYSVYLANPATGVLFITDKNPSFISGQIRMRGRDDGRYPYHYLEMIDTLFGREKNTVETCSRYVPGMRNGGNCFTIDINGDFTPDLVGDAQCLKNIPDNVFDRWRGDPPYNEKTAVEMYKTSLPRTSKLLSAGARICKPGSLLFLLLGPQNYQPCPPDVKRIGFIPISIVPNNELRALNIFLKLSSSTGIKQGHGN